MGHEQQRDHWGPQFKTYTRYSGVDDKKQKKVLGNFKGNFEAYTRYSGIAGKSKNGFKRFKWQFFK